MTLPVHANPMHMINRTATPPGSGETGAKDDRVLRATATYSETHCAFKLPQLRR